MNGIGIGSGGDVMIAIFWIVVAGIGVVLLFSGLIAMFFRNRVLGSELAKMGAGLKSFWTKRGVHHGGGSFGVSSGGYIRGIDESGIPVMGETRKIIP